MKNLILVSMFCLIASSGFAWQTLEEEAKHLPDEKKIDAFASGKFYLNRLESEGTSIIAVNVEEGSFVRIRKVQDKFDFVVYMDHAIWEDAGAIFLRLLDREGFQLCCFKMGNVGDNFSGKLCYSEKLNWVDFFKVYSYEITMKY